MADAGSAPPPHPAVRVGLPLVIGLVAWFALIVPGDGSGGALPYVAIVLGSGALLGAAYGGRPWLTGVLLVGPALLLAPWTAPRGDGSLWGLVFPYLVWWGTLASVAHAAAAAIVARFR